MVLNLTIPGHRMPSPASRMGYRVLQDTDGWYVVPPAEHDDGSDRLHYNTAEFAWNAAERAAATSPQLHRPLRTLRDVLAERKG